MRPQQELQIISADTSIHIKTPEWVIILLLGMCGGLMSKSVTENQQRRNDILFQFPQRLVYCEQITTI